MIKTIKFTLKERFSFFLKNVLSVDRCVLDVSNLLKPMKNIKISHGRMKNFFFLKKWKLKEFSNLHAKSCQKYCKFMKNSWKFAKIMKKWKCTPGDPHLKSLKRNGLMEIHLSMPSLLILNCSFLLNSLIDSLILVQNILIECIRIDQFRGCKNCWRFTHSGSKYFNRMH